MNDDNIKWIDIGEKMVKQMLEKKQKEYGRVVPFKFVKHGVDVWRA